MKKTFLAIKYEEGKVIKKILQEGRLKCFVILLEILFIRTQLAKKEMQKILMEKNSKMSKMS